MKWNININQKAIVQHGLDIDMIDAAIFDCLKDYTHSTICKKMQDVGGQYYSMPYKKVMEELPLLPIKTNDGVYRRFKKLEVAGLIEMHEDNAKMGIVWFKFGRNYEKMIRDEPTDTPRIENRTPGSNTDETEPTPRIENRTPPDEKPTHPNTFSYTFISILKDIVGHLNEKSKSDFKPEREATKKAIGARLKEGFSKEDFLNVIDFKCLEWTGTDYEKYLRPETLFCAKHFESYLMQAKKWVNEGMPNVVTKNKKKENEKTAAAAEILEYLNKKADRSFNCENAQTQRFVISRLNEGVTIEEAKRVIDFKVMKWRDGKMSEYLSPDTLFGEKFAIYLAQATPKQPKPQPQSQNGSAPNGATIKNGIEWF